MTSELAVRTGSLRRRVVLAVLGVLLVVLVVLGLAVNLALGDRLRSDLRQRLADRASLAQVLSTQDLDFQQLADRLTGQGITATYRRGDQVVIGRDQPLSSRPPGPRGPRPPTPSSPISISQQGALLVASLPVGQGMLSLTANLTDIDRALAALQRIELAAGAATLLLSALLLILVVGVAVAPLSRMTRLAKGIRDGARGRRLRPTQPRTDLGRTATAIDEMLDALEQAELDAIAAESRMRQFLADASHDLRTPIAGTIGTAELILRENPDRIVREQQLVQLIREARRAGRLVDDLLLMARLDGETGPPPKPLPAATLVMEAINRAGIRYPDRQIIHAGDAERWMLAELSGVERILANVLDNALRAAGPGGSVRVAVTGTSEVVRIQITDSGPGVPVADAGRIFDRFVRLDVGRLRLSGSAGSGLGLPIARGLARSMGGDVRLSHTSSSAAGRGQREQPGSRLCGATFELILPLAGPPESVRTPAVDSAVKLSR